MSKLKSWEEQKAYIDERVDEIYKEAYNKGFNDGAEAQRQMLEMVFKVTRDHNNMLRLRMDNHNWDIFENFVLEDKLTD